MLDGAPFSTLQFLLTADAQLDQAATLRLDSYQFGASNRIDVLGDGSKSLVVFDALTVTANQQENPPAVFSQIAESMRYARAVLTQRDANGEAVSAWVLANVAVLSEDVRSDGAVTLEELSLSFSQITEASAQSVSSWDLRSGKPQGPAVPIELRLKPYASTASSADLQLFIRSTDQTPAVELKLDSFQFGIHNSLDGEVNNNAITFDKLQVTAAMTSSSPELFKSLTTGSTFALARLTQRDALGNVSGTWSMRVAAVIDQQLIGSDDILPVLDLDIDFGTLATATPTSVFQWDRVTNREIPGGRPVASASNNNSAPIAPVAPIAPAAPMVTGITLDLRGGTAATAVSLYLDSFKFGFHRPVEVRSGQFVQGIASFDSMDVTLALPNEAPQLLASLLTDKFYGIATLTQRNSSGAVDNVWVLENVLVGGTEFIGVGDGSTQQRLSFEFFAMSHATSSDRVSWNQVTQRIDGPPLPSIPPAAELPGFGSSLSLNLFIAGSNLATLSIPVNSFVFGTRGAELLDTGTASGPTSFDPLEVTTVYQSFSPKLLTALIRGTQYARATITKGVVEKSITLVTFGTVFVTDTSIDGRDQEAPNQTLKLSYGQVTESAGPVVRSWDILTSKPVGPTPPSGFDLAELPAFAGNLRLVLGSSEAAKPDVDVMVDATEFGFEKSTNSIRFDAIKIQTALGAMSPVLFGKLASRAPFFYGRVTQVDFEGNEIATWQLRNVYLKSDVVLGDQDTIKQELEISYQAFVEQVGTVRNQWDRVLNKGDFSQARSFNAAGRSSSDARQTRNGAILELSGGNAPNVSLALDAFDFGYINGLDTLVDPASYLPLNVSLPLTPNSAKLFSVMTSGQFYETATIYKYDNSAVPTAAWVLKNVSVQADRSQAAGAETSKRLSFKYDSLSTLAATDTQLTASSPSIVYGQTITLTATVRSNSQVIRGGAVTFSLGGQTLATVPVDANGRAVYVLDSLSVASSPYAIEALYQPTSAYLASLASVDVTVTPATLTIRPNELQSKLYGAALPVLTYRASGFVRNDTQQLLSGALGTTALASSPVGAYAFLPGSLTAGANYKIQLADNSPTFAINPAVLNIAADNKTKVYGTENPALTATISGLVNNDDASVVTGLTLSTTATSSSPPSSVPYPITAANASAANYTVQYVPGNLTITAIELSTSGVSFTPTAGAPFSGVLATFTVPGSPLTEGSFVAQVAWGNGRSSGGVVTQNGNTFVVTGKHTFGTNNSFNVRVSIRHTSNLTVPVTVSSLAFVTRLGFGQAQNTDYWSSNAGQTLIRSFNGSSTRTELANWLAESFPNIYGATAGANNLSGKTNAIVASYYLTLTRQLRSLEQEVLATALSVYASKLSLGGAAGGKAGFQVTLTGLGANTYNVGNRGSAFNVADNTQLSVLAILGQINNSAAGGTLYSTAPQSRPIAEQMLEQINLPSRSGVLSDQVKPVDFWVSDRGVSLIRSFGGPNSRQLSSWLTATFRNLYGTSAGVNRLIGRTNTQVAAYLQSLNNDPATQTAAQVLTTALNLYASTLSLGGTIARTQGFNVTDYGLGAGYFNIDQSGIVAGVANRSTINVYALMQAIDRQSVQGRVMGGNAQLLELSQQLFRRLNNGNA